MKLIGSYKNGNYITSIFDDGTKVRATKDDSFIPDFAENMDIKITDYCDMGCKFCHEGSGVHGNHGDILNASFIDTLHPFQEVAIGGGDATSHPDLIPFLKRLKEKRVIANLTVNQYHFESKQTLIRKLVDEKLIYGIGVSLVNSSDQFISMVQEYPNAVLHVINGVINRSQMESLYNRDLKILILGYKYLRRGIKYYGGYYDDIVKNQQWLYEQLPELSGKFKTLSFDNLAIEQLNVKRLMTEHQWEEFYMGDDGSMTFYIDMVNKKYARSSTADFDHRYDILSSVDEMFKKIRKEKFDECFDGI